MDTLIKVGGLVEYQGISSYLPLDIESFTQILINDEVYLSEEKPNIENAIKASADVKILNTRIIKTPKGISLDGIKLTGHKLIIYGEAKIKIQYVADDREESIHSSINKMPFISYIVMPEGFSPMCRIVTSAFIEDIFVEKATSRSIYGNIALLLTAEIC